MARKKSSNSVKNDYSSGDETASKLRIRKASSKPFGNESDKIHAYGKGAKRRICTTNSRGHKTPEDRSPLELVVDTHQGFVPLWGPNVTLNWRFNEASMQIFVDPDAAKDAIRQFLGQALMLWGDAAPVKFSESDSNWDFEFVMMGSDNCSPAGCTLARAFFPDSGRHNLALFPILFDQPEQEIVETFIHELGHVFGLRHFFALVDETAFPAEVFGTHNKFSIMNYGEESVLTPEDKSDLKALYSQVWSGELTEINGTEVRLFRPFHEAVDPTAIRGGGLKIAAKECATEDAMRDLLIELLKQQ